MSAVKQLKRISQVYRGLGVDLYATVLSIMKFDTAWFKAKIKESRFKSQRQLAFAMDTDPSLLSKFITGLRPDIPAWDLFQMHRLLNIPLEEIYKRAGFDRRWAEKKKS